MFHVLKSLIDWKPSSTLSTLQQRADMLQKTRAFFAERDIIEVETPLLCQATVTAPHIASISAQMGTQDNPVKRFLQTSPEYCMKRLLAAGCGPIYQICKAFRAEEAGRLHNPEFTMLEWYRPGFDYHQLMDEVDSYLQWMLATKPAIRVSYRQLFEEFLQINPHAIELDALQSLVSEKNIVVESSICLDKDTTLQLLMTHVIEPNLIKDSQPYFVFDFPSGQAALARCYQDQGDRVSARFEVYFSGYEVANGYDELTDAMEHRQRFANDNQQRKTLGLESVEIDERFLTALENGLPACAGVALGFDRLVMIADQAKQFKQVVSFYHGNT